MLAQPGQQLQGGRTAGDLVVEDDHVAAAHVSDDRGDRDPVVVVALLGARRYRQAETLGLAAHRLLVRHLAQRKYRLTKLPARGREQEPALVPLKIDGTMQFRPLRPIDPPYVMTSRQPLAAQPPGISAGSAILKGTTSLPLAMSSCT